MVLHVSNNRVLRVEPEGSKRLQNAPVIGNTGFVRSQSLTRYALEGRGCGQLLHQPSHREEDMLGR